MRLHTTVVIELNTLREGFQQFVLVLGGPVLDQADIRILYENVQPLFNRHVVEFLVDVAGVLLVTLQTEDGEVLQRLRLVNHGVEAVGVLQRARGHDLARVAPQLALLLLTGIGRLLHEVGGFINLRTLQNLGFDGVRSQFNFKTPLLDLLALGDHGVQIADGLDAVVRLLEETLAHRGHNALVLAHTLRDAYESAEFGRQINVLALLFDFKQRLVQVHNLNIVLLLEVQHHGNGLAYLTLFELA